MIGIASSERRSKGRGKLPDRLRRFAAQRDGAAAVEFALIAVPFFLVVMATVQTAVIYFAQQSLETIAEQASRYILTNQATNDTQSQFNTLVSSICTQAPLFNCSNLMVNVQSYGNGTSFASANTSAPTITFSSNGQVTNKWQFSPGSSGDIVVLQVMYQWPVYLAPFGYNLATLSNGNRLLMATAVFRNEPL